jgi:hypothetical protein
MKRNNWRISLKKLSKFNGFNHILSTMKHSRYMKNFMKKQIFKQISTSLLIDSLGLSISIHKIVQKINIIL